VILVNDQTMPSKQVNKRLHKGLGCGESAALNRPRFAALNFELNAKVHLLAHCLPLDRKSAYKFINLRGEIIEFLIKNSTYIQAAME